MSTADTVTTLELAGVGSDPVACVTSVEPGTGHTRYKVKGNRIAGVVTVIPAYDDDNVNPFTRRVRMLIGDCANDHAEVRDHDHDHLLMVNGFELTGAPIIDITRVKACTPQDANQFDLAIGHSSAHLSRSNGAEVSDLTRRRLAKLFAVIIDHWRSDPGNHAVRLAAARYAVRTGDYLTRKATAIRQTSERIAELGVVLGDHTRDCKRMERLRDSTDVDPAGTDPADPDPAA